MRLCYQDRDHYAMKLWSFSLPYGYLAAGTLLFFFYTPKTAKRAIPPMDWLKISLLHVDCNDVKLTDNI